MFGVPGLSAITMDGEEHNVDRCSFGTDVWEIVGLSLLRAKRDRLCRIFFNVTVG